MTVDGSDNTPMGEMQEQLRLEMQDDDDDDELIHYDQSLVCQCLIVEGPIGQGATRGEGWTATTFEYSPQNHEHRTCSIFLNIYTLGFRTVVLCETLDKGNEQTDFRSGAPVNTVILFLQWRCQRKASKKTTYNGG